jgi:hypothetical protein
MGSKKMIGPLTNLQVKADGREKQKSERKYTIGCRRKPKVFSTASILVRGAAGGLRGLHVALSNLMGSRVLKGII